VVDALLDHARERGVHRLPRADDDNVADRHSSDRRPWIQAGLHHSAVELVDRAAEAGLVCRLPDADDGRLVRLELTRRGRDLLERLSAAHLEELARLAPMVQRLAADLSV
jgi:hypothetical protein